MRMERLTSKFQIALADAQSLAVGRDHQFIEPVHLMTALLDQEGGSIRHLLTQSDVNVNQLRSDLGKRWINYPVLKVLPVICIFPTTLGDYSINVTNSPRIARISTFRQSCLLLLP